MKNILAAVCFLILSACIRPPYNPTGDLYPNPANFVDEPQFTRGEPNFIADALGKYVFSLPEKAILANWKMGSHQISPETEEALREYLEVNGMKEVKVRLNEYAPFGEWKRLTNNQGVGAGWRYTVGVINWLFYTIFPGRIFGGDNYNPFTNTISLYSDLKVVAIHEGGHAKDTARDEWKGSYAMLRAIPFYALRDEAVASTEALTYYSEKNDLVQVDRGYKSLYPAYGTYLGGSIFEFVPGVRPAAALIGAIPGHIIGRIKASGIDEDSKSEENPIDLSSDLK